MRRRNRRAYRITLISNFRVWLNLAMLPRDIIIDVLLIVNCSNRLAQAAWLASTFRALALERADNQAIAEQ